MVMRVGTRKYEGPRRSASRAFGSRRWNRWNDERYADTTRPQAREISRPPVQQHAVALRNVT